MGLFLTAGLGSGSTFQMIAVIFRRITLYNVKLRGGAMSRRGAKAVTFRRRARFYLRYWRCGRLLLFKSVCLAPLWP